MRIDPPVPPAVPAKETPRETAPTQRIAEDPVQKQPGQGQGGQAAPHRAPAEADQQDVTLFSTAVIALLLEQQPPPAPAEEIAEIRRLLDLAAHAGIEEIAIALGQPLRAAVEAALAKPRA